MKKISFLTVFVLFVSCSTSKLALEKEIKGTWVVANQSNPKNFDVRIVTMKHGKFKSEAISGDNEWLYNQGEYAVINESTIVTVHKESNGDMSRYANLYEIHIDGDTLHFKGYYIQPYMYVTDGEARLLATPALVDEVWVKE